MKERKFLLTDLFEIKTTKGIDKTRITFANDGEYDFIGRTTENYGVQGALHKLSFDANPKDTFSLIQIGETAALWREKEWYASQNIFLLIPKTQEIKNTFLYVQTAINKVMKRYGKSYNVYPTMESLNDTYS